MANCVLLGLGEVGSAVYKYYTQFHDIDIYDSDPLKRSKEYRDRYDIMLVCIPYSEHFEVIVETFKGVFNPSAIIVFSTVQIGTCDKLGAYHAPVEGKHPDLYDGIKDFRPFVGGDYDCNIKIVKDFFSNADQSPYFTYKAEITEALKLLSTTFYGICIEYYRYAAAVLKDLEGTNEIFKYYNALYNELYEKSGYTKFRRPLLDPPTGKIGGHCVVENSAILNESYPDRLVSIVLENMLRKE